MTANLIDKALAHMATAIVTSIPSDDAIIMNHVRAAKELLDAIPRDVRDAVQVRVDDSRPPPASPDVLSALEMLLPVAQAFEKQASKGAGGRRGGAVFEQARAAIAKARNAKD